MNRLIKKNKIPLKKEKIEILFADIETLIPVAIGWVNKQNIYKNIILKKNTKDIFLESHNLIKNFIINIFLEKGFNQTIIYFFN